MSTENLSDREAIEKLKTLVDKIDIGILCTYMPGSNKLHAIPMSRQEVDDAGNIWFLCSSESETYKNLESNKHVTLIFSDIKNYNFLSIDGHAEVSRDQERIEKYWNKMNEAWFEKGKEDPTIRVLKVTTNDGHYWDNKTNKLVTFLKMATSAVTGAKMDVGRSGTLDL